MSLKQVIILLLNLFSIKSLQLNERIDLTTNWTLFNLNSSINIRGVQLPASVHTILVKNKLIPNPLERFNDLKLRWIAKDNNWAFHNEFKLTKSQLGAQFKLHLESVDTIATVYLNGVQVFNTDNQFVEYKLNTKLNSETNVLEIRFDSAIEQAEQAASLYPYRVPPECPPNVQKGECHINFIRKQQCSFSWDWGPAFAPIGLNGRVYLDLIRTIDFDYSVSVYPNQGLTEWIADVQIEIERGQNFVDNTGTVTFRIAEFSFELKQPIRINQPTQNFKVDISGYKYPIQLWWPSGLGEQKLYNFTIEIVTDNDSHSPMIVKQKTIGFRKIEIIQTPTKPKGLTFYFEVNSQPIFLKGSNWIPADSFQELVTPGYLSWLLGSAKRANMNVLRVWGGGVYEQEAFYELADRMGILIWQDFMFACATYPTNEAFLVNVESEVIHQVNRLRHHPSIAVWAGNNENEAAIATNWYDTDSRKELYSDDYRKLYINTVKRVVDLVDPLARPFLSSSPTNGLDTIRENWIATNPYDLNYGDEHFYDYKMNGWEPNSFYIPRFMSEYGVQSLPSFSTLADVYTESEDANIFGELNEHRQHHGDGNQQIVNEIQNNLRLPITQNSTEYFKHIIYLSQINQAMYLRTGSELFRRSRSIQINKRGNGLCSGTMYWQFNDLWQAPTWSSIEYVSNDYVKGGKWKMAHYFIKKAYSAFLLSPVFTNSTLDVYAVSDLIVEFQSTLTLRLYSYSSLEPKFDENYEFSAKPLSSDLTISISLSEIETKYGCSRLNSSESCILTVEWADPNKQGSTETNFLFFQNKLADVDSLNAPELVVDSVSEIENNLFKIVISTNRISLFTWLDVRTSRFLGTFSENGFHMVTETATVLYQVESEERVTVDDFKSNLSVISLGNLYN